MRNGFSKEDDDPEKKRHTAQQYVGNRGEDTAISFLLDQGYTILHRNYRALRGEIDIICLDPDRESTIVFVEVKARSNMLFDDPLASLSHGKMNSICRAAEVYVMHNNLEDTLCQFDVIGIMFNSEQYEIEHVKDVMDY